MLYVGAICVIFSFFFSLCQAKITNMSQRWERFDAIEEERELLCSPETMKQVCRRVCAGNSSLVDAGRWENASVTSSDVPASKKAHRIHLPFAELKREARCSPWGPCPLDHPQI